MRMRLELALIVGIIFFCCWCAFIVARMGASVGPSTPPASASASASAAPSSSSPGGLVAQGAVWGALDPTGMASLRMGHRVAANQSGSGAGQATAAASESQRHSNYYQNRLQQQPQPNWLASAQPSSLWPGGQQQQQQAIQYLQQRQHPSQPLFRQAANLQRSAPANQLWPAGGEGAPLLSASYNPSLGQWHAYSLPATTTATGPFPLMGRLAAESDATTAAAPAEETEGVAEEEGVAATHAQQQQQHGAGEGERSADESEGVTGTDESAAPESQELEGGAGGYDAQEQQEQQEAGAPESELEEVAQRRAFSEDESDSKERDRDGAVISSKRRHLINGKPVGRRALSSAAATSGSHLDRRSGFSARTRGDGGGGGGEKETGNLLELDSDLAEQAADREAADFDALVNEIDAEQRARREREEREQREQQEGQGQSEQQQQQQQEEGQGEDNSGDDDETAMAASGSSSAVQRRMSTTTTSNNEPPQKQQPLAQTSSLASLNGRGLKKGSEIKNTLSLGGKRRDGLTRPKRVEPRKAKDSHEHRLHETLSAQQWDDEGAGDGETGPELGGNGGQQQKQLRQRAKVMASKMSPQDREAAEAEVEADTRRIEALSRDLLLGAHQARKRRRRQALSLEQTSQLEALANTPVRVHLIKRLKRDSGGARNAAALPYNTAEGEGGGESPLGGVRETAERRAPNGLESSPQLARKLEVAIGQPGDKDHARNSTLNGLAHHHQLPVRQQITLSPPPQPRVLGNNSSEIGANNTPGGPQQRSFRGPSDKSGRDEPIFSAEEDMNIEVLAAPPSPPPPTTSMHEGYHQPEGLTPQVNLTTVVANASDSGPSSDAYYPLTVAGSLPSPSSSFGGTPVMQISQLGSFPQVVSPFATGGLGDNYARQASKIKAQKEKKKKVQVEKKNKKKKKFSNKSQLASSKYKAAGAQASKRKSKQKKGHIKKKKRKSQSHFVAANKRFKGTTSGLKAAKGAGERGAKKGAIYYKDKGYKKRGFKKAYHKLETGDHKTYFDEFRDKDHKHKWKNFKDKHKYSQKKKWRGADKKQLKHHHLKESAGKASQAGKWRERAASKHSRRAHHKDSADEWEHAVKKSGLKKGKKKKKKNIKKQEA